MKSQQSIMIVDDDKDLVSLVERILKEEGYQVIRAYDGNSALALSKKDEPDLIILDILMPGIDGYSVCSNIKMDETTKDIPVLMLTALSSKLNKQLAQDVGADGYITKPFNSKDLLDTIARLLKSMR